MNAKARRVIKLCCLFMAGFILIFSVVSMIVVKYIYDGQFPRYDRHDETVTAGLRFSELEADYPRELVSFQSGENHLQGYVYGGHQNQGLVVVVHGLGGGADSYLAQITYFVDQGWRVFAYDATGSFDSEGESTKGFPQALLDLDAALTYICAEPDFADLPLLLFGHSWGGYAVANILHYDYEIEGVASVSGPNSSMSMVLEQGRRMMGGFINTQYPYLWLYQRILFGETASLAAIDTINASDVPVLIVHGIEDEMVHPDESAIVANANELTNPKAKVLLLDKPGHSGHNDIFRSEAAAAYVDEVNIEYLKLYDQYDQNIPYEIRQDFYTGIDRALAQDLNKELMDEINMFFKDCLKDIN